MMPGDMQFGGVLKSKLDKVLRIERYFGVQRHAAAAEVGAAAWRDRAYSALANNDSSSIGATGVRVWKTASSKVVP
jgi:hypothetical protein